MNYFSRLTDIVTCNLSEILAAESEPKAAILKVIAEMEEGLAGANRSVKTATASRERLEKEMAEHQSQIERWAGKARQELAAGDEDQARIALMRKQEVEDVVAGLGQQHKAAVATSEHLTTMLRALEARLAEARRKRSQLESGDAGLETADVASVPESRSAAVASNPTRAQKLEAELAALKLELGRQ